MKINFRRYLLYLFSIVVLAGIFYVLVFVSFATFDGGFKQFDELNKTLPFISVKSKDIPISITTFIVTLPYFIIFVCGFKMVYYVNLHVGLDQNMKRLLKQLTKTLIILVIIPFLNQSLILLTVFITFKKTNDSSEANHIHLSYIFLSSFTHFTPVFNPIVCILTNKPYKEAVFNRLQIHPQ
uniref:G-protein coupled receptors family 1 profile domain-containing protein n=1 Tax=Meloidogyne incognita TaxID=6306 RepID=A0A914MGV5_MELIC